MKKGIIFIIFVTGFFFGINAQEVIVADTSVGCDSLLVAFELQNAGDISSYSSVHWNFGDDSYTDNVLAVSHVFYPGIYTVTCLLNGTDLITLDPQIEVRNSPLASFTWKDTSETEGTIKYYFESENIAGTDISYTYYWLFPDNSEYTTSSFFHEFTTEEVVDVFYRVTDDLGCTDTVIMRIPVSEFLFVANVFSPNGDGLNDYFEVTTNGENIYRFTVFTRTGSTVFRSESPRILWDGRTFDGREVPVGVYYYVIENVEGEVDRGKCGFIHLYR